LLNAKSVGFVSGRDFTACGKTRSGFMQGIYPRHNANQINEGFGPGGMLLERFAQIRAFFRNLFSPEGRFARSKSWSCDGF
jgi:hypothetical protein